MRVIGHVILGLVTLALQIEIQLPQSVLLFFRKEVLCIIEPLPIKQECLSTG